MTKISSLQNTHIRKILSLRDRKGRESFDEFVVEGIREITKALNSHLKVSASYFCPSLLSEEGRKILDSKKTNNSPYFELTEPCYNKIAVRKDSEGLLLAFSTPNPKLEEFKLVKKPLLLLVEGLEKPGNLGALIRSADGAGLDAIFMIDSKIDLYNPNVIRASLGCCFTIPIFSISREEAYSYCKQNNIQICAALLDPTSQKYSTINFQESTAFLLGSEDQGLNPFWHSKADFKIFIPMHGQADSLNVSVAGAILMYEARRQR